MEELSVGYWNNEDYNPSSYKSSDKLEWIWRKGLNWGKTMVVTGVDITSAPLFLPPFVALSIVGFAFSVPAGFAFVTYACTEKFVSGLLPMPTDDTDKGYGQDEDEDEESEEGYNEIGLNKNKGGKYRETVEESLYDQDANEYMKHEEQILSTSAVADIVEGIRQAEEEISSMKNQLPVDSSQLDVVEADLGLENEKEEKRH